MTDDSEIESLAFPYTTPKSHWVVYSLAVSILVIFAVVAFFFASNEITFPVFLILAICAGAYLLVRELMINPFSVRVETDGFTSCYRFRKDRFHSWEDMIWLHFNHDFKGDPGVSLQFKKKLDTPMYVSYAAGLAISEAYSRKMGRRPMDIDEYLKATGKRFY